MLKLLILMITSVLRGASRQVDLIELNHFYEAGELKYSQVIFYEWSPDYRRFDVVDWKFSNKVNLVDQLSRPKVWWVDDGRQVVVTSRLFRETFTDKDPEREHRRLMDESCRRGILRGTHSILER